MRTSRSMEGRQTPMSLNEVVLVHMFNLSGEIVRDGLMKEYEPAVDRVMYWLFAEFQAHKNDKVDWPDGGGMRERRMGDVYAEVMNRDFGNPGITDKMRAARIRDKEMLLSVLLYSHKVNLGGGKGVQFEKAGERDYDDILEGDEEEAETGGHPGAAGADSPDPFAK